MIIHSPIISGSLTFADGATFTLPDGGVYSGSFSGSLQVHEVNSSIIPSQNNVYDLGSITNQFKDLYLSSASLYIDGTQVLSSNTSELIITTDTNQSFKIVETGADTITLQSANGDITLTTTGTGNIELDAPIQIAAGNQIISSDGNPIQFGEDITVNGVVSATTLAGSINATNGVVSGSSQVSYVGLSNIPSGIVSESAQVTSLLPSGTISGSSQVVNISNAQLQHTSVTLNGTSVTLGESAVIPNLVSGSAQIVGILSSLNTYTGSNDSTNAAQDARLSSLETASGSAITRLDALEGTDITVTLSGDVSGAGTITNLGDVTISTTIQPNSVVLGTDTTGNYMSDVSAGNAGIVVSHTPSEGSTATISLVSGVVSGSAQVVLNDANKTGFDTGDVSEGSNLYYTDARVKTKLDAETVVSGSSQILTLVSIDEDAMTSNSDTKLPTQQSVKAYVDNKVSALVDSAPGTLDTLNELAAALGDDANFSTTLSNQIAGKVSQSLEIISGNGLTGGGNLTTNRTLAVGAGDGISVAADSVAVDGTVLRTNGFSVVSGSAQVDHDSTTNFVADEHIAHSGVSITAGNGLTGGGTIDASRTIDVVGTADRISVSADAVDIASTYVGQTSITTLGTIGTGTWQGSVIASAYLDADTAHLTTTQTFSGAKTFSAAVNISDSTASTSKTTGALIVTGGVGVSGALNVGGDVVAYASSDKRLKDNIKNIENPIEKVQKLNGVTWDWNSNADELQQSLPNVGVIAQEVEEVFPQLVHDRDNGYKGVDYAKLTGLLIEAIKDQQKQIDELKSKLG